MEVCRVSDGATQDIGFDSDGFLQTSDIVTFSGGGEVRVRTWYDQTGNLRHATNATSTLTELPKIYTGSAFISGIDGNACVQFIRTDATSLSNPNFDTYTNGWLCITASGSTGSVGDQFYIDNFGGLADRTGTWFRRPGGVLTTLQATSGGGGGVSVQYASGTDYLWVSEHTGSNLSLYTNGLSRGSAAVVSQNDTEQGFDIGRRYGLTQGYADAISSEIIFYNSNQSSIRQGLEANLNDYYQFTNLPDYTSGFLADYSGAAAAYSVRKLSNTAIKALRVRRNVPPYDELDIGFTDAGDLDEQAIIDFGGSDVLVVSRWYDQSGFSRHAVQDTPGNQPQIYNGTAVITENGKPAIRSIGQGDFLNFSGVTVAASGGYTSFAAKGSQTDFGSPVTSGVYLRSSTQIRVYDSAFQLYSFFDTNNFDRYVLTIRKNNRDYDVYKDTTNIDSRTLTTDAGMTFSQINRGLINDPNSVPDDGFLHEVIIYPTALSDIDVAAIQNNIITEFY